MRAALANKKLVDCRQPGAESPATQTITNPDMTKKRSTPLTPETQIEDIIGDSPDCRASIPCKCAHITASAAIARKAWIDRNCFNIPPTVFYTKLRNEIHVIST